MKYLAGYLWIFFWVCLKDTHPCLKYKHTGLDVWNCETGHLQNSLETNPMRIGKHTGHVTLGELEVSPTI